MRYVAPTSPARVVVADDDAAFRSLLATKLRRAGYEVTEMHDGRELLDALLTTPPGFFRAVISDHRMPGLFGLECLAFAGSRAPFVIVSGSTDEALSASASELGAVAVIPKSTALDALVSVLAEVVPRASPVGSVLKRASTSVQAVERIEARSDPLAVAAPRHV